MSPVDGNDTWSGRRSSYQAGFDGPWKTIGKANTALQAGDTVLVGGGTYSEMIRPANSGTADEPIVYRQFENQVVRITDVYAAIWITQKNFVRIAGMHADDIDSYIRLDACSNISIEDCVFENAKTASSGWPVGVRIFESSHHNTIRGCRIGRVGYCRDNDDKGGVMTIGRWEDPSDHCDYNLIEENVIFHGGHHLIELVGSHNTIRNNYFHNEEWMPSNRPGGKSGNRLLGMGSIPSQCRQNLIEGNRFVFSGLPPDGNTSSGMTIRGPDNIIRKNSFCHNDGPGLDISTGSSYPDADHNKVYNNTFFHNGYTLLSDVESWKQVGFLIAKHGSAAPATGLVIKNNLFHDNHRDAMRFYYVDRDSQIVANNWEHAGDPLFRDIQSPITPENPGFPDLRLRASSPCIDAGTYLTQITSPTASGLTFQVGDAGCFMDGWGIIEGDLIQVENSVSRARIVHVDYETNMIEVDTPLTWQTGAGLSLAYEGTAPDIGAFEFGDLLVRPRPPTNLHIVVSEWEHISD